MINLYIVDYFNIGRANGLSTYVNTLTKGICARKEINLHYIWINSTCHKSFTKKIGADGVHYYIPGHIAKPNDPSGYDLEVTDFLAGNMSNQRNVIVHFNWINHCPFAYTLKRRIKCKVILTKHCIPWRDLMVNDYPLFLRLDDIFSRKRKLPGMPPALMREQMSYDAVDHIICVTKYARSVLIDLFHYSSDKVTVIYNGLPKTIRWRNKIDKGLLREQYGFDKEEKIILFAGNVDHSKGIWDLLKAFESLETGYKEKELRLLVAGGGKHGRALSMIKKGWSKVTFTGNIDKETLYDFYSLADMGIVPSYVEQCSYTAIEMMHADLPLIVSEVDGLKEIVPDDCGLKLKLILGDQNAFIDPGDLKDNIRFYIEHETEARKYAERARSHAQQSFCADKMIEKTINTYEYVLQRDKKQKPGSVKTGPLVSILIPCYNAEKYINDCLKSVFEQSYFNFEIVLIDDGSTDHTTEIINKIRDHRIRYYKNSTNKGVEYTRNRMVSLANGKYIACLDADDMMHPDRLLKQVTSLEQNAPVAMVGSWHYVMDQFGKTLDIQEHPVNHESIRILMLFRNPFLNPSVMIRANILKELRYSYNYRYCEDYELWFKIVEKYQVANIPEYLTFYRIHDNNISALYSNEQKQNTIALLSEVFDRAGLKYSAKEMALHGAICFGYCHRYFNSEERINDLNGWLEKLLNHLTERSHYSIEFKEKVKDYVVSRYCGLSPEIVKNPETMYNPS